MKLTPKQDEVLRLIARGKNNRKIGEAMGITLNTVKFHTNSIFRKLGVQSRIQAITKGLQLGLLEITDLQLD